MHHLTEAARSQLAEKGFYYHLGAKTEGLPDFYRSSFHTHDYIKREWGRYFEVLDVRKEGLKTAQDAVLVRSR